MIGRSTGILSNLLDPDMNLTLSTSLPKYPMAVTSLTTAGNKQKKAGAIPHDWKLSCIGAEFKIQLGKMLDASKNIGVPKPYIGNRSVQWGRFELDNISTVPMTSSDLQRYRLQRGDLLVCEGGEIGRAAIWDDSIPECYFQKAIHRLRPLGTYDTSLMMYFLQMWTSNGYLDNFVTQTSIAHLPKEKLELVPLPVPPPDEQRDMAAALSDVDGLLVGLDVLIAKKRDIKQAAMQQLLTGRTRLPGFSRKWETKELGEAADVWSGATPNTGNPVYWNGTILWCTPTDISSASGKYLLSTERSISTEGLANCAASLLPVGALLLCSRATVGEIKIAAFPICTNQGFKSLVCRNGICNEFLYYLLLHFKDRIVERATGSTFLEIGKQDIASIEFDFPCFDEQCVIATVLSDMDAEIAALERRRDKTRAIKRGMMEQLLTGRVRLV